MGEVTYLSRESAMDKAPTGIDGLDELTHGGFPRKRLTLVCGGPGTGKTLMGMQFLVRGAIDHDEPGVLFTFERSAEELSADVASLGWDLDDLDERDLLAIDSFALDADMAGEGDSWTLDVLTERLDAAVDAVGARRVMFDGADVMLRFLADPGARRFELGRLVYWIRDRGLTGLMTAEVGERGSLTRAGVEEHVADCVLRLDHSAREQRAARRLQVVKYRGCAHSSDLHTFAIRERGLAVGEVAAPRTTSREGEEAV